MRSYSIQEYEVAGCKEMRGAMLAIHGITTGKVCDTGCYAFNEGKCLAYLRLTHFVTPAENSITRETVRQEATRRCISISQVRRERNRG